MTDKDDNSQTHDEPLASLLTFPTEFPIKVMGKNDADFRALVTQVTQTHIAPDKLRRIDEQCSKNNKYLSCTVVAEFASQAEIDAVYQAFTASGKVLMAL